MVAPGCDLATFHAMAREFAGLDWRLYMRTIRAMGRHDAWPRLGEVTGPTLVVGGTRDLFLPEATLRADRGRHPRRRAPRRRRRPRTTCPWSSRELLDQRIRQFQAERIGSAGAAV